jgi:DNA-binding NarL/FixJ family response regulator
MGRRTMKLPLRQRQVLRAIRDGMTNDQIAADLGIKPKTVESHVKAACARLGVRRRPELVAAGYDRGILQ